MWFYKFFRFCFFVLVLSLSIWTLVSISPDKCNCSSPTTHNTLWTIAGVVCSLPIFFIIYEFPTEPLDRKLFFKLFSIPKEKYKYTVDERIDVNNNTSKYFPLVKTAYFYPPFYIQLIGNTKYKLIDPKHKYVIGCDGYESDTLAMQAIANVKLDINRNSFKYRYDMWVCHICPVKSACYRKVLNEKPLKVKIKKTFNK